MTFRNLKKRFPSFQSCPSFTSSRISHPTPPKGKSAPFRVKHKLYPLHYIGTFASSCLPYPQSHRLALRLAFLLKGELRAYHVPHICPSGLGPACRPRVQPLRRVSENHPSLTLCLFWLKPIKHLGLVSRHDLYLG